MTWASALALALAVVVLGLTPGPVVVTTVARALASGFAPAIGFIAGVAAIDLAYLLLAVAGLSALAHVLGEAFVVIKIAGGLYLVWLGIQMLTASGEHRLAAGAAAQPFWRNFATGAMVDLGNPKLILFYAAFLPTFVELERLSTADVVVLAAIVVGTLAAINVGFAWLAARAGRLVRSSGALRRLHYASGTLMIGCGVWVAAAR
jgi:threonine/homoserine/homoserine lactone efflux protein